MPKLSSNRLPKYRRHPNGQAIVSLSGRLFTLGKYGTPASREKYHRLLREWDANGRRLDRLCASNGNADLSINELLLAYWKYAETYYRKPDGTPTSELENIRKAFRRIQPLYGHTPASEFGPLTLEAVRMDMIASGWSRGWINRSVGRIDLPSRMVPLVTLESA